MIEPVWYILLAAFVLDYFFADPDALPHPVVYMGNVISFFEKPFRNKISNLLTAGVLFAIFLISSVWLISFSIIKLSIVIHPAVGDLVQAVLLFFCFSARSLEKAGLAVYQALNKESIDQARKKVGMIVGRETEDLDRKAITRATIETVAENLVDGFLSPLFFYCIGGVPFAMAYKMINTLDSMVGYKNDKYFLFGRGAARIDDVANFIPARLSVIFISLSMSLISFKQGRLSFRTGFFQGHRHKSPNAGYPEAAFSGALGIRLGGPSVYHGKVVKKPFIGDQFDDPGTYKIKQACDLMILASLAAIITACLVVSWL